MMENWVFILIVSIFVFVVGAGAVVAPLILIYKVLIQMVFVELVRISAILRELKDANKDKQRIETIQEEPNKPKWKHPKVAQPSPEDIAPALRSPPRPQGGFGVVLRTDDNTPVRETDSSEVGGKGGETKSSTTNPPTKACGIPPTGSQTGRKGGA